ncbi:MAG TPA: hypothetical protein VN426_09570 [Syntrophomonadaceae bacterium]|nr:hypothetical protein [Syntrophomonadaceae bacterium]
MKNTKDYGRLFLWLSSFSLFFAFIISAFYQNALLIGMAISLVATLISLIIYTKEKPK